MRLTKFAQSENCFRIPRVEGHASRFASTVGSLVPCLQTTKAVMPHTPQPWGGQTTPGACGTYRRSSGPCWSILVVEMTSQQQRGHVLDQYAPVRSL